MAWRPFNSLVNFIASLHQSRALETNSHEVHTISTLLLFTFYLHILLCCVKYAVCACFVLWSQHSR